MKNAPNFVLDDAEISFAKNILNEGLRLLAEQPAA